MIDKLEYSLNGGFNGLYGEVVTEDIYRIKTIEFIPDVIFDMGSNIGIFTRFARSLFPDALIIAVEPNIDNCGVFIRFTEPDNKIVLINKAIGDGGLWRCIGAANGAHECYLSEGLGYPQKDLIVRDDIIMSDVETIMPDEIINRYLKDGMKSMLKLDIEGGENIIWNHKPSMDAIKKIDYIAAEIHFFALDGTGADEVREKTMEGLKELEETHYCKLDNVNFWATKK